LETPKILESYVDAETLRNVYRELGPETKGCKIFSLMFAVVLAKWLVTFDGDCDSPTSSSLK
jgi:hypothetical protein